jgi:hypothetical protein
MALSWTTTPGCVGVCYTARAGMQRYWYSASLETQGKSDKKTEGSIVKCGSHETFQQIKLRIKGDGKENPAEGQDCRETDDECGLSLRAGREAEQKSRRNIKVCWLSGRAYVYIGGKEEARRQAPAQGECVLGLTGVRKSSCWVHCPQSKWGLYGSQTRRWLAIATLLCFGAGGCQAGRCEQHAPQRRPAGPRAAHSRGGCREK